MYRYQYLHKKVSSNDTVMGYVTLPYQVEESEIFYESGNTILISHFGMKEYNCVGSCYCDDGEEFKIDTSIGFQPVGMDTTLTHDLVHPVTSWNFLLAKRKAGSVFEEECKVRFSHVCVTDSIRSHVVECDKVKDSSTEEMKKYFCSGNCVADLVQVGDGRNMAVIFGCERLSMEFEVEIKCGIDDSDEKCLKRAKKKFMKVPLMAFCQESSHNEVYIPARSQFVVLRRLTFCAGELNMRNPSVDCRPIF